MWKRRSVLVGAASLVAAALGRLGWIRAFDSNNLDPVRSVWLGATTATTVTATIRTRDTARETLLLASADAAFERRVHSLALVPDEKHYFCRGTITNLWPDTHYYLRVKVGDRYASQAGQFKTPPAGAHSFSFGLASCSDTGSEALIFDVIRRRAEAGKLDFFIHTGDLHYANIEENDVGLYHAAYDRVFDSPPQNAVWRSLPMYYIWDDHDYGPNGSHGASLSRQAAVLSYRARVPSPALAARGPEDAVYYSFTRGRVRFVVTDLRSEKNYSGVDDSPSKIMLEREQMFWFRRELQAARHEGQVVCWVNTHVWLGEADEDSDRWFGYVYARQEMTDLIASEEMEPSIFIASGDMHALAFDDGTNNAWGGFPVLHAAPLDRNSSQKGGPYSAGPFPPDEEDDERISQYGIVEVDDGGESVLSIRFVGLRVDRETGAESVIIDETFRRNIPAKPAGARL